MSGAVAAPLRRCARAKALAGPRVDAAAAVIAAAMSGGGVCPGSDAQCGIFGGGAKVTISWGGPLSCFLLCLPWSGLVVIATKLSTHLLTKLVILDFHIPQLV